jgi:hypothetical protein
MSEDFSGLYDIRPGRDSDKNFILATFLRGLYYGESFFSRMPKDLFMNKYKLVANALVNDKNVLIKVACLPEDPDVVLGYSVLSADQQTVFWVFVKSAWRKRGIAKSLLPQEPKYVAHLTKLGDSLLCKFKTEPKLNPFF